MAGFGRLAAVEADRRQGVSEVENYGRGPWQEGLRNSTLYITLVALQCKYILAAIEEAKGEVILLGDFNAYYLAWGGKYIASEKQAERLLAKTSTRGLLLTTLKGKLI